MAPLALTRSLLLGLIGDGITASRTPGMHEAEGARLGIPTIYRTIDVALPTVASASLDDLLTAAIRLGFDGLNITHPFKQEVCALLDEVAPEARRIGSVNTVVIDSERRTTGYNTDVTGFARGFEDGLEGAARDRVVQIGAGGAGRAVAFALSGLEVGELVIADVSAQRAHALAEDIGGAVRAVSLDQVEAEIAEADGIVNATPMGMRAHPGTPVDTRLLRADMWVADVVYLPLETQLLREAKAVGCRTLDGSGMAVNQAVDAFALFSGTAADPARMRQAFLAAGS